MATTVSSSSGSTRTHSSLRSPGLRSLDLHGPAGRLEALLNEGSPDAPYTALLCHPHPKGGGTLHSKVIYHAMKVVNDPAWGFGWPALRFNFRGTGLSEGVHDGLAESMYGPRSTGLKTNTIGRLFWSASASARRWRFAPAAAATKTAQALPL